MKKDFCAAKYRTDSSVSDLLTRGEMKKDFCAAKYRTDSSVSDLLTRGEMKKDFCAAKYRTSLSDLPAHKQAIRSYANAREQSSGRFLEMRKIWIIMDMVVKMVSNFSLYDF
ncbi:hypothetical protein ACFSC9_16655 [Paenibacillus wenxiniae]|uniref:Uncharacterized protein n=2 Tax=Paenibacillus wenxiniae TaxID=1636843 RepID=A0ABW4RLK4_9BACL